MGVTWASMSDPGAVRSTPPEANLDVALVARLCQRDELALAQVYDLHAPFVYGLLLRMLDHASAQEITQDVFMRLWERPQAFDPARASLRGYLLVTARSRGLDRLRAQRHTQPLFTEEGAELPLPDRRAGPVQRSEDTQRQQRIGKALAALSADHREAVKRAFLHGQTREEIALALGIPVGTVKSRISYALKHLKKELGEEVSEWLD